MDSNNFIERKVQFSLVLALIITLLLSFNAVLSVPEGPVLNYIQNETRAAQPATSITTKGGTITTMVLNATAQNVRWKAYVGNVSGTLTLDDSRNYTIFEWRLTTVEGEVYASRSSSIDWSNVNCTWSVTKNSTNRTIEENENLAMNHTFGDDNITATFSSRSHQSFYIGANPIASNSCYSIHTFVNDTAQSTKFEEVLLYDGLNATSGDVIYSTILEQDELGFDKGMYDFQMIVPEKGLETWTGSTPYYFYVELT